MISFIFQRLQICAGKAEASGRADRYFVYHEYLKMKNMKNQSLGRKITCLEKWEFHSEFLVLVHSFISSNFTCLGLPSGPNIQGPFHDYFITGTTDNHQLHSFTRSKSQRFCYTHLQGKKFDLSTRFCFKDSSFIYTSGSGGNDEVPEILSHKNNCSIKFGRCPRQLFKFDRFTQIVYNRLLIHLIHYYTPLVLFQID